MKQYLPSASRLYRDTESGEVITELEVFKEFQSMSEEEQNGRTFYLFLLDCLSKNGFLEMVQ